MMCYYLNVQFQGQRVKQANSPFEGVLRERVGGVAICKVTATESSFMTQTLRQIFV